MACLACHDTDAAKVHGLLITYIPDPSDPYGSKAQESCEACHGKDREFSPDKVHRIANPFVPPYRRAPRELRRTGSRFTKRVERQALRAK